MIDIKDKKNCCGCSACQDVCPQNCIKMVEDDEGFRYPTVDIEKCINCGLCDNICPINNNLEKRESVAYVAISKDENERLKSSSGGVFSLLVKAVLKKGGVVCAPVLNKDLEVEHVFIDDEKDLEKIRGSKYIQSKTDFIFKQAKDLLENKRLVLFSGTPCQVSALYSFLRKDYDNLITQDIVCHGVPSVKVWRKYLSEQEKTYKSSIIDVRFRNKDTGWNSYSMQVKFANGQEYLKRIDDDLFFRFFLSDICLRPSCHDCKFKERRTLSDITLADYWGVSNFHAEFDDNKGTSLVLVNTAKGENLFSEIQNFIISKQTDIDMAIRGNPAIVKSAKMGKNREMFFNSLNLSLKKLSRKCLKKPFSTRIRAIKNKLYNIKLQIKKNGEK